MQTPDTKNKVVLDNLLPKVATLQHCHKALNRLSFTPNETRPAPASKVELKAHQAIKEAQKSQTYYANQKRRDIRFKEGDLVFVATPDKELAEFTSRPSWHLADRYIGPYKIEACIPGNAYCLRLPGHSTAFRTFYVSRLRPYHKDETMVERFPVTDYDNSLALGPINAIVGRKYINGRIHY